jgi:hypothetical protein
VRTARRTAAQPENLLRCRCPGLDLPVQFDDAAQGEPPFAGPIEAEGRAAYAHLLLGRRDQPP